MSRINICKATKQISFCRCDLTFSPTLRIPAKATYNRALPWNSQLTKPVFLQSPSTNNVKMYAFNSSAPHPVLRTGPLTTFFPQGSSIPQPLRAALGSNAPARVHFFGGSPRYVFSYSFNALAYLHSAGFHDKSSHLARKHSCGCVVHIHNQRNRAGLCFQRYLGCPAGSKSERQYL